MGLLCTNTESCVDVADLDNKYGSRLLISPPLRREAPWWKKIVSRNPDILSYIFFLNQGVLLILGVFIS